MGGGGAYQTFFDIILKVWCPFYMMSRSDYKSASWLSVDAAWKKMKTP